MKKFILFLLVLAAGAFVYFKFFSTSGKQPKSPKDQPMLVKKHSDTFNLLVDSVVQRYGQIQTAFVSADVVGVKEATTKFIQSLDALPLAELDKDTASVSETAKASIEDVKSNANSILQQTNIDEMRRDFNMVTEMMYPSFFKSINYEGTTVYLQHCPMAFDNTGANWLSTSPEIVNPYLGNNHPKYHATMLNCGEVKDSITAGK